MIPNSSNAYLPGTPTIPGMLLISNMTNAYQMVVTIVDSIYNTYIVNQCVYLTVPNSYGMFQANGLIGQILEINGFDFTLNIDSTQFDQFVIPPSGTQIERPASLSPAGSRNLQYNNFSNRVAFQSPYNRGN